MLDVLIVGAGPAGLSAALWLGRCRRRVLICDTHENRNAASHGLHGYLTRDGIAPERFLKIARAELKRYDSVEFREMEVVDARCSSNTFEASLRDGSVVQSRKLLIASGVIDNLPMVEGVERFYGKSLFHCPYCDGWEVRDRAVAVYGKGKKAYGLALELLVWSRRLTICSDGPSELSGDERERLNRHGISIREEKVLRFEGKRKALKSILFADGTSLECEAAFFSLGQRQRAPFLETLGCRFTSNGAVRTGKYETTEVPGLYVAGDASQDVQFAIVAAAEGTSAAFAINTALIEEDLHDEIERLKT